MTSYYKDLLGDSALYAGMLHEVGCPEARDWIDSCIDENGRLWRNPFTANAQEDNYSLSTSSRDMFIGALLGASERKLSLLTMYLHENRSHLAPSSPDNRHLIFWGGWAKLYIAAPGAFKLIPLYRTIQAKIGYLFLGVSMILSLIFAMKPYEINLIYADLMFYRRHNKLRLWDKLAMYLLTKLRQKGDGVYYYLKKDLKNLHNRAATAQDLVKIRKNDGTYNKYLAEWPPSTEPYFLGHEQMSEIHARWLYFAFEDLKRKFK